ncbi:SWIM zinc finger domain-containing protein [Anaerobacillus sp. MEB173]|uniref:SWIM zinc finger family protein n=1 Tax=Anaerobacillus sp. MEB173 TaxID=3383345 RepID=UPI003F93B8BE
MKRTLIADASNKIDLFLKDYVLERIIHRGNQYFEKGTVQSLHFLPNDTVEAIVEGTEDYQAIIDLNAFEYSTCTCPYEDTCKHIVAVLLEIKEHAKIIQTACQKEIAPLDQSLSNLDSVDAQLRQALEPYFIHCYRKVTSNQFFNHHSAERIVQTLPIIKNERKLSVYEQLIILTLFIEQIYALAQRFETLQSFSRRYTLIFKRAIELHSEIITEESANHHPIFHHWFSTKIEKNFFEALKAKFNPWEQLLMTWIFAEKDETYKKKYLVKFIEEIERKKTPYPLLYLASIIALHCEEGAKSLALIRQLKHPIRPNDLAPHFQILKDRHDWEMMKHWFDLFLPKWTSKDLQDIQPFYEEMLIKTKKDAAIYMKEIWDSWLQHPTFTIYEQRMEMLSTHEEKEITINYLLTQLEEQLYNPSIEKVYYQILHHEKKYNDAIYSLLLRENEPHLLNEEKKKIINAAKKIEPEALLPFYHQMIERLIQKKSRTHYQDAVSYIKELKGVYHKLQKDDQFITYVERLRKQYKSYRALIQELKKIELHV